MKFHNECLIFVLCGYITAIYSLPEIYNQYPSFSARDIGSQSKYMPGIITLPKEITGRVANDANRAGKYDKIIAGQAQFVIGNETMSWSPKQPSKRKKSRKNKHHKEENDLLQSRELKQENQSSMGDKEGKHKSENHEKRRQDAINNLSDPKSNGRVKLSELEIILLEKWQDMLKKWKENKSRLNKTSEKDDENISNDIKGRNINFKEKGYATIPFGCQFGDEHLCRAPILKKPFKRRIYDSTLSSKSLKDNVNEYHSKRNYVNDIHPLTLWTVVKDEESQQPLAKNFTVLASENVIHNVLNNDKASVEGKLPENLIKYRHKKNKGPYEKDEIRRRNINEKTAIKKNLKERAKGTEISIYDDINYGGNNNYESSFDDDYDQRTNNKGIINDKERKKVSLIKGIEFDDNIYDDGDYGQMDDDYSHNKNDHNDFDDHDKKEKLEGKGFTYTININDQNFQYNDGSDKKSSYDLYKTIKNNIKKTKLKRLSNKNDIIHKNGEFGDTSNDDDDDGDETDSYKEDSIIKKKEMEYFNPGYNGIEPNDESTDNNHDYDDRSDNKKITKMSGPNKDYDYNYSDTPINFHDNNEDYDKHANKMTRKGKEKQRTNEISDSSNHGINDNEDYFEDVQHGDDTRIDVNDFRINVNRKGKQKNREQGKDMTNNDYYDDIDENKTSESKTEKESINKINKFEENVKGDLHYEEMSEDNIKNFDEYEDNNGNNNYNEYDHREEDRANENIDNNEKVYKESRAIDNYDETDINNGNSRLKEFKKEPSGSKSYKNEKIIIWAVVPKKVKSKGENWLMKKEIQKKRKSQHRYEKRRREKEKRTIHERREFEEESRRRAIINRRAEQDERKLCLRNKSLFLRYGCNGGPCLTGHWQQAMKMRLPYFNC